MDNEGDDLPPAGGDAAPSVVSKKVRGMPVVRFALGTSNLLSCRDLFGVKYQVNMESLRVLLPFYFHLANIFVRKMLQNNRKYYSKKI